MSETLFERRSLPHGGTQLLSKEGAFVFYRPRPGVVLIVISGDDKGQFGAAPHDELRGDLTHFAPCEIFIDLSRASLAHLSVQKAWTEWFARNRSWLKAVNILVAGKYIHVTVELAKLFSRTGELIRVYFDPALFDEALERSAPGAPRLRSPAQD